MLEVWTDMFYYSCILSWYKHTELKVRTSQKRLEKKKCCSVLTLRLDLWMVQGDTVVFGIMSYYKGFRN